VNFSKVDKYYNICSFNHISFGMNIDKNIYINHNKSINKEILVLEGWHLWRKNI